MLKDKKYHSSLDSLDRAILRWLQMDSSITHAKLAENVGASIATCQRRVMRLKDSGVIRKEVALLDGKLIGRPISAICEVTLVNQAYEVLEAFEHVMQDAEQVQQCYRVSAGPDFIVILTLADMDAYQAFAASYLTSQQGIRNVRTFFVNHVSKFETSLPITSPP